MVTVTAAMCSDVKTLKVPVTFISKLNKTPLSSVAAKQCFQGILGPRKS